MLTIRHRLRALAQIGAHAYLMRASGVMIVPAAKLDRARRIYDRAAVLDGAGLDATLFDVSVLPEIDAFIDALGDAALALSEDAPAVTGLALAL